MDNFNSQPQENFDRNQQMSESASSLLNWTSQDNQSFRSAQSTQTGDLTLTNTQLTDQQKPEVERTGHDAGAAFFGGVVGGIAGELLFGGTHHHHNDRYRPYYPPPVYRPYPVPYPSYPQYPHYPSYPNWGGGHHGGGHHGGGHHGGGHHGGGHHGGHRHRW